MKFVTHSLVLFLNTSILLFAPLLGPFSFAISIVYFLTPNMIDGGIIGVSMIFAELLDTQFFFTAYCYSQFSFLCASFAKSLGKSFVIHMCRHRALILAASCVAIS